MHVDLLPVAFLPINNRRYEHQCVLGHEVPYASFSSCVRRYIKLECPGERQKGNREEEIEVGVTCHYGQRIPMNRAPLTVGCAVMEG